MRLPAWAHLYGIKPWELQELSLVELEVMSDGIDELTG